MWGDNHGVFKKFWKCPIPSTIPKMYNTQFLLKNWCLPCCVEIFGYCHYFQHSMVDINFFARTVPYTFLEMFFKPQYSVHGIGCNFWKSKLSPDPSGTLNNYVDRQSLVHKKIDDVPDLELYTQYECTKQTKTKQQICHFLPSFQNWMSQ